MDDLITDLRSPQWWMSVVVAGILVNLAAGYLLKLLDARLAKASSWWRRKRESAVRERAAAVDALQTDRNQQARLEASEIRYRLRSLVSLVQAIGMGLLFVLFATVGAPAWLTMFAVALFAIL